MKGLFAEIAEATSLREGPAGVEKVLWTLARTGVAGSRELAGLVRLPVPVVAAIRRELEKRGLLERNRGMAFTDEGRRLIREHWGISDAGSGSCSRCGGDGLEPTPIPEEVRSEIREVLRRRPLFDVTLDQAHLTEESVTAKAAFLLHRGLLVGKRLLFVGDDDFLAPVALILARHIIAPESPAGRRAVVVDIDSRIIEALGAIAEEKNLSLEAVEADARAPLSEVLRDQFDVALTDPPYTLAGGKAFLDRCLEGIGPSGDVVFSYGAKDPGERFRLQRIWCDMRLVLTEFHGGFNRYEGGAVLAGRSDLILLSRVPLESPEGDDDAFYTADVRGKAHQAYRCNRCGKIVDVGPGKPFATIRALRAAGCPDCGADRFRYASKGGPAVPQENE